MTEAEAFKIGFLARCAEERLSPDQTAERVKAAGVLGDAAGIGGTALKLLLGIGVGAPMAGGMLAGHQLAKAQDDDLNVPELQTRELIEEYNRMADLARRQAELRARHKLQR
jgi:hypothetical protein